MTPCSLRRARPCFASQPGSAPHAPRGLAPLIQLAPLLSCPCCRHDRLPLRRLACLNCSLTSGPAVLAGAGAPSMPSYGLCILAAHHCPTGTVPSWLTLAPAAAARRVCANTCMVLQVAFEQKTVARPARPLHCVRWRRPLRLVPSDLWCRQCNYRACGAPTLAIMIPNHHPTRACRHKPGLTLARTKGVESPKARMNYPHPVNQPVTRSARGARGAWVQALDACPLRGTRARGTCRGRLSLLGAPMRAGRSRAPLQSRCEHPLLPDRPSARVWRWLLDPTRGLIYANKLNIPKQAI